MAQTDHSQEVQQGRTWTRVAFKVRLALIFDRVTGCSREQRRSSVLLIPHDGSSFDWTSRGLAIAFDFFSFKFFVQGDLTYGGEQLIGASLTCGERLGSFSPALKGNFVPSSWRAQHLKCFEDELVLGQSACLVTEHVVELCQVLVEVEVLDGTGYQFFLVGIEDGHLGVELQKVNVHKLAHLESHGQVDRYERIVDQEEAEEGLERDFLRSFCLFKDVPVLVAVLVREPVIEVG